jgi:putative toxin-antitoxin system antitoxin component (TIGR02293 family)
MNQTLIKPKAFDTKKSIQNASKRSVTGKSWTLVSDGKTWVWTNNMERVTIIREGIPYVSLEVISKRLNRPVKYILKMIGLPQTTYNKKKSEHSLLDSRDSELVLLITEIIDFGMEVFNNEGEKFQNWLKKGNISLGGNSPESLFDTTTGIDEVNFCLNRLEYGNLA